MGSASDCASASVWTSDPSWYIKKAGGDDDFKNTGVPLIETLGIGDGMQVEFYGNLRVPGGNETDQQS